MRLIRRRRHRFLKLMLALGIIAMVMGAVPKLMDGASFDGFKEFVSEKLDSLSSYFSSEQEEDAAEDVPEQTETTSAKKSSALTLKVNGTKYAIPDYSGNAYVEVNGNTPFFTDAERECMDPVEKYPELDKLGRCGSTLANICPELMPEAEREEIGKVKPSGWHTVKYPDLIEDRYLFNRCHLIGFQLAGENANEKNLITGTRYLNIDGMLDHENLIARYVCKTGNHVMYRVTPVFAGDELVSRGVLMEGWSVEDSGKGVNFCIFAYNVQPGISIDYATGESRRETDGLYDVSRAKCSLKLQTP